MQATGVFQPQPWTATKHSRLPPKSPSFPVLGPASNFPMPLQASGLTLALISLFWARLWPPGLSRDLLCPGKVGPLPSFVSPHTRSK